MLLLTRMRFGKSAAQSGNATVFILMALLCIMAFTLTTLWRGVEHHERMQLQLTADAAATTGALWQARGLNLIAGCNLGISIAVMVALTATAILIALTVCSLAIYTTAVCAPILAEVAEPLYKVAKYAYKTALELSKIERQIAKYTPAAALGYSIVTVKAYQGSKQRDLIPIPYPFLPETFGADPENKSTLSLHLADGDISGLIRSMVATMTKDIRSPEVKKSVNLILDNVFKSSGNGNTMTEEPDYPNPLVLSDDFRERIKFSMLVYESMAEDEFGLYSTAQATVILPDVEWGEEDLNTMAWRTRLTPVDFLKDLLPESVGKRVPENN